MNARKTLISAAIGGMLSVVFGAFGAHALKHLLGPVMLTTYHTAVQYQMYHSLALLGLGVFITTQTPNTVSLHLLTRSALCFLLGIFLFCGSLYALSLSELLTGNKLGWLGAITPFGGLLFIIAWLLLLVALIKNTTISKENEKV